MTKRYDYDSWSQTYAPGVQYATPSGVTVNGSSVSTIFIPMILSSATLPTYVRSQNESAALPIIDMGNGIASGGSFATAAGGQFPKISLEGTIDVPLTSVTETGTYSGQDAEVPAVQVNSVPMHWVDVIAMFFEGRYTGSSSGYARYDPSFYRDPYGRRYDHPRVMDFTASFVAGVPTRANFTMQLMIIESAL